MTFRSRGALSHMRELALIGMTQFLREYPGMSTAPCQGTGICLRGQFEFTANRFGFDEIRDSYELKIIVPENFPQTLVRVEETAGKIPRNGRFHTNPDGSLCLGTPLKLLIELHNNPNIVGFAENCLVPYLYAVSIRLSGRSEFVLGELAHGIEGLLQDYSKILGLSQKEQVIQAIQLLCLKDRIANKSPCPCGCGKRLGICPFRHKLNSLRKIASTKWFRQHAEGDLFLNWNK